MLLARVSCVPSLALLLALSPAVARPQGAAGPPAPGAGPAPDGAWRSAPVGDLRYELTFTRETAQRRTVRVATTFTATGDAPVLLSLPAWTPGAYELTWFARWVLGFEARGEAGRALAWDKVDHDTWRILPAGARTITVRFDVRADSLDNAMAWSRADFLLVNGTNVFLYPEGLPADFPATVTVRTESDWRVATGMSRDEGVVGGYAARSYHDLVDMPFFVGRFDLDSATIAGRPVRFASYPMGSVAGARRAAVWDWLRRVIPPQVAVFGEVPWAHYTVMQIADTSFAGASGLEHQNSHVDVVTPLAVGSDFMPSLYAHEIFHAWNVKRLRPAELWPYRYDQPQPTPWLWVSEGITDYYADLAMVRGGVVGAEGFYDLTSAKITEVGMAAPVSLEDASLSTWVHPVDGTQYIYYAKGSLAGLLLDIMLRDATDNRRSLDDVLRDLYASTYKRGRGFTAADWWESLRRAGVRDVDDFYARYVDGREPFPWERILPLAGMRLETTMQPRLGISSVEDAGAVRVTEVEPGGAAAEAGVRVGDVLVAVGDIPVLDESFGARFRERYGARPNGTPLPLRVRRGAQTVALTAPLRLAPSGWHVRPDPAATPKARRIREGILRGSTDR